MPKENLDQSTIDKLIEDERLKAEAAKNGVKPATTKDNKESGTTTLICLNCEQKMTLSYSSEKEKITAYFTTPKLWKGKPCTSPTGHGFVLKERYEARQKEMEAWAARDAAIRKYYGYL